MTLPSVPANDLNHVLRHTEEVWSALRGAHFLITGATGFYGKWLLESISAANNQLGTGISASLPSRDPTRFAHEYPRLAMRPEFDWCQCTSLATADFPQACDFVIDLATPTAAEIGAGGTVLAEATLASTAQVIAYAKRSGATRVLYASSGAVYGTTSQLAYCELKKRTEALYLGSGLNVVIARGFAFIGPYLPLTNKFAVGSFIRDALAGGPIRVQGDGTPVRSFLYGADLAVWLLTLLVNGDVAQTYDVGSDEDVSIGELARRIAAHRNVNVIIEGHENDASPIPQYVPTLTAAHTALGLRPLVRLDEAIGRTLAIHAR
ncbi:MAG: NAD(P)-dependent oxidoreductase [Rhodocyclaceae bacterium]|jgi:nucleoside-diphosphate-sugar epimerase|nr:NAD(P)-dependent oxidoreductase [Rhodocyclaceae bacterium]MBK6906798.1 NAD(P)-dependent oxidoreductase [Rhodocyclaceae bacterium]